MDWDVFVKAILLRFGVISYDDPMKSLTRLRQIDSMEEYKVKFEVLSNGLRALSKNYKLNYFWSGLKDEIRLSVRMFNPMTLLSAYDLLRYKKSMFKSTRE